MGLFVIAGLLIGFGVLYWALDEKGVRYWTFEAKLFCFIAGGAMLLVLLFIMGTNRATENVVNMEEDYIMYTLALEGCDTMNEYMVIADRINAYNDVVEEHRKMRKNKMTNWLFSPKIAEMPLIVVPDFKLQEAE